MLNMGDKVYRATYKETEKFITCPDCCGTKHVSVILGDGTSVTIECGGCDPGGYQSSTGAIKQYEYKVEVVECTVVGVRAQYGEIEYDLLPRFNVNSFCYYTVKDEEVFCTHQEAAEYGEVLRLKHESEANKRLMAKTKDHKSWAWNAAYHMRCIKKLEAELEYHKSKAIICREKSKSETVNGSA